MNDSQAIVDILTAFEIEPKPCDLIVADYFKRNRHLGSRARRHVTDAVFTIIRMRRRIDGYLALSGVKKFTVKARVDMYLLSERVDDSVDLSTLSVAPKSFPGGMAAFYSYPDFLFDRMKKIYSGESFLQILNAYNQQAPTVVRVNANKISRSDLIKKLELGSIQIAPAAYSPHGIIFERRADFASMKEFKDGLFEVQDEASQLVSFLACPDEEMNVLDYCAGAGGKTLAISSICANRAKILATDISTSRLNILKERAKRSQSKNIQTMPIEKLSASSELKNAFDIVLVDAPCTGTGTIRRSPDIKWRLRESDIFSRSAEQIKILSEASKYLKKGGRLVYATCSFLHEENEHVVGEFVKNTGFTLDSVVTRLHALGIEAENCVTRDGFFRTDPSISDMDGFFAASFVNL